MTKLGRIGGTLGLIGKEGIGTMMVADEAFKQLSGAKPNPIDPKTAGTGGATGFDFLPAPPAATVVEQQKTQTFAKATESTLSSETEKAKANMQSLIEQLSPMFGETFTEAIKKGLDGAAVNMDGNKMGELMMEGGQR